MNSGPMRLRYAFDRGRFSLDLDLELPGRGVTGVFGRSGAGKTSLLRCIAGLEAAADAYLEIDGDVLDDSKEHIDVGPHQRRIGAVFQEPRLFDHLTVAANLDYGARRRRAEPIVTFDEVVDLLGISRLLDRRPDGLSGGEAQRVAIGRALLSAPRLVLMDEPLSSLDLERREEILPFLETLHASLPVPMLYVSHQPDEVLRLADYLVVMDEGRVSQHGRLNELLVTGKATGLPEAVVLDGTAARNDGEFVLTEVSTSAGPMWVTSNYAPGTALRLIVRASDVSVTRSAPESSSIQNVLPATITGIRDRDESTALIALAANGSTLLARVTRRAVAELKLATGDGVFAQIKSAAVRKADTSS